MTEIITEFDDVRALVRKCLIEEERCRNSDRYLQFYIWREKQGLNLNNYEDGFKHATNPETIRRNRAHIQNKDGVLLPTDPEVIHRRNIKEEVLRGYYSSRNPELLEKVVG